MRFMVLILPVIVLSQVACTEKEKSAAVAACADDTEACVQKYIQVAGGAAASGTSAQVAIAGAIVEDGQVPSTSLLPASVYAKAAEVQAALAELEGSNATATTSVSTTTGLAAPILPSSVDVDSAVEIGVTRLSDSGLPSDIAPASANSTTDSLDSAR